MSTIPVAKRPGDVLLNQFMTPHGLSTNRLATLLRVKPQRVWEILNGRRRITAETALRLSRFFGNSPQFWLDLQTDYELVKAEERWAQSIEQEILPLRLGRGAVDREAVEVRKTAPNNHLEPAVKLSCDEKLVLDLVSQDVVSFDVLCQRSGMSAGPMSSILTMLELSLLVRRHPGDCYSRL